MLTNETPEKSEETIDKIDINIKPFDLYLEKSYLN